MCMLVRVSVYVCVYGSWSSCLNIFQMGLKSGNQLVWRQNGRMNELPLLQGFYTCQPRITFLELLLCIQCC